MIWFNVKFVVLVFSILLTSVQPAVNWLRWFKTLKLVKVELLSGRTLGIHKNVPTNFEVLADNIKYNINPSILVDPKNHGPAQADILSGKGLILKGNLRGPITFSVDLPSATKSNICGLVITSLTDKGSEYIFNLRAMWKSDERIRWDLISNPTNGEFEYFLRMRPKENTRVILFDSIPALHFMIMLTTIPGKNVNFKMAFIGSCKYKDTIEIKVCGEKLEKNTRFAMLPAEVPISIKCPIDCIRTWPCWGYKVYSADSPICWAATQNFGRYGNGYYTIYKIPSVVHFRLEINYILNHGIFCRRSTLPYSGFTFDRKYMDFSKKEYRNIMGA